ncbi:hypothetical protein [Lysobacter olei]
MKSTEQRDLLRESPKALAEAHREAARAARRNPYETPDDAERRARYYEREAERLEAVS